VFRIRTTKEFSFFTLSLAFEWINASRRVYLILRGTGEENFWAGRREHFSYRNG
jgi:hypothetical protein